MLTSDLCQKHLLFSSWVGSYDPAERMHWAFTSSSVSLLEAAKEKGQHSTLSNEPAWWLWPSHFVTWFIVCSRYLPNCWQEDSNRGNSQAMLGWEEAFMPSRAAKCDFPPIKVGHFCTHLCCPPVSNDRGLFHTDLFFLHYQSTNISN